MPTPQNLLQQPSVSTPTSADYTYLVQSSTDYKATLLQVITGGLPSQTGNSGKYLVTDGSGNLSWHLVATSVSAGDSTLTISPTTGAVVCTLNLANANTWSAAQTFTLAPTFSSMTSASVLFAGSSGLLSQDNANLSYNSSTHKLTAGRGITLLNGTNSNTLTLNAGATASNLTFTLPTADGTSGQALITNGSGALSFSTIIGVASVSNSDSSLTISPTTGAVVASLNVANANTWTGQQTFGTSSPIFATMTQGSILFAGTSGLLSQDNSNLFWDASAISLGVGTNTFQLNGTTFSVQPVGFFANNSSNANFVVAGVSSANIILNRGNGNLNQKCWQIAGLGDTLAFLQLRDDLNSSGIVPLALEDDGCYLGASTFLDGALIFNNASNSNTLRLKTGATASNVTFTLPTADGTSGQVLKTNGSGVLSFTTIAAGVTSVSNSDGTLTISPTTGAVVASLALSHANTWTGQQTFLASSTSTVGAIVKGASGQTADLQQWLTNAGTLTAEIDANGAISTRADSSISLRTAGGSFGLTIASGSISSANGALAITNASNNPTNNTTTFTLSQYYSYTVATQTGTFLNAYATTSVPLTVNGVGSQTGNLTEWKNSGGTVLSSISASGDISAASIGATTPVQAQGYRPINTQTGTTYTLVLGDAGKLVTLNNSAGITLTVPANSSVAYATGTEIDLAQLNTGQVTISAAGGVTVNSFLSLTKIAGQYGTATLKKTGTDTWLLTGNLSS